MKHFYKISLAMMLLLLIGSWSTSYAGTRALGVKVTNLDNTPFDGSFHDGTGVQIKFVLNAHADTLKVRVKQGNVVVRSWDSLNAKARSYNFVWDGKNSSNAFVLSGRYSVEVFTSDTGNSSEVWAQAWLNKVRGEGQNLSTRDIEVVNNPASPWFGDVIVSESGVGQARLIHLSAAGDSIQEFGKELFPASPTGVDPWYLTTAQNGDLYVSSQTNTPTGKIFVFQNGVLTQTIADAAFPNPRGIAALGSGNPTLLIAQGGVLVRRSPAGVSDTVFNGNGYVRDVVVDDSGYVYVSFGASSTTYTKVVRGKFTANIFGAIDTLTLPARVTHLYVYRGSNLTTNADDSIYARVRDASNGVYKLNFAAKTSTKLFLPAGTTNASDYHGIATDVWGNIYYANAQNEYVALYIPPGTTPQKNTATFGFGVSEIGTKTFEDFNVHTGHLGDPANSQTVRAVTFSGTTVNVSGTATRVTNRNHSGAGGGAIEFALTGTGGGVVTVRQLFGGGTPANNDSLAPYGYFGYWMRTSTAPAGAQVAVYLDDPSDGGAASKSSIGLPVINDGEWHLYQWDLTNNGHWIGALAGTPTKNSMVGPRISVDGLKFTAPSNTNTWVLDVDDVSYNPYGVIGIEAGRGDVSGAGGVTAQDASLILQSVAGTITLTEAQTKLGDVNLSDEGTAVTALDASVILANVVAKIPFLPWTQALPGLTKTDGSGSIPLKIMLSVVKGMNDKVTIPVSVPSNLAGLRSVEVRVVFDNSAIEVTGVKATDGFAVEYNIQNGYINIAMARGEALEAGGQIFVIEAKAKKEFDAISVSAENVKFNDIRINSVTTVGGKDVEIPSVYKLEQNYPNPFNPSTTIEYQLPDNGLVQLKIYDVAGREVATLINDVQNAGSHQVQWNATDVNGVKVASGVYFYRLTAGNFTQIKKMMLLK